MRPFVICGGWKFEVILPTHPKDDVSVGWARWDWYRKPSHWFFKLRLHRGFGLVILGFFVHWWKRS